MTAGVSQVKHCGACAWRRVWKSSSSNYYYINTPQKQQLTAIPGTREIPTEITTTGQPKKGAIREQDGSSAARFVAARENAGR